MKKNTLILLLLCFILSQLNAQSIRYDVDSIINEIHLDYPNVPGIVIGVHHPDYGQFLFSSGLEQLGGTIEIDTNAIFGAGSINKNVMWVLMHRLHQDGLLNIYEKPYYDNPIGEEVYINQLQDTILEYRGSRFSISDLMKHSTGMVDVVNSNNYPFSLSNIIRKDFTIQEALTHLFNSNTATNLCPSVTSGMCDDFILGTGFEYSSYGPAIASVIAEIETGIDGRQLLRDYIFEPLSLSSTSFISYDEPNGTLTSGHDCIKDSTGICTSSYEVLEWYDEFGNLYWDAFPVSSLFRYPIYSNASDLLSYLQAQFNNENFISEVTLDSMKSDYVLWYNVFKVGLGIVNYDFLWSTNAPEDDFFGHAGDGTFGHGITIAHRAYDHLSIVVLTNIRTTTSPDEHNPHFSMTKSIGEYFLNLE